MSISPVRSRGNNWGSWVPVTVVTGQIRGMISTEGTLRAHYQNSIQNKHIKGTITLERWAGNPTRYRIAYNGIRLDIGPNEMFAGAIPLPRSPWSPVTSKGKSENMVGRLLHFTFNAADTDEGLVTMQIMIPLLGGGHRASRMVFEAFCSADSEQRSQTGERLVGRHHY